MINFSAEPSNVSIVPKPSGNSRTSCFMAMNLMTSAFRSL